MRHHSSPSCLGRQALPVAVTISTADPAIDQNPAKTDVQSASGFFAPTPVVNVVAAHDYPFSGKTTILVAKNVLQVKGIRSNLIPSFLLRKAGLIVNDTPLIHVLEPKAEDHSIVDPESGVKIHMSLNGVFSGFETRALTQHGLGNLADFDVVWLMPDEDQWDPYDTSFAEQEVKYMEPANVTRDFTNYAVLTRH